MLFGMMLAFVSLSASAFRLHCEEDTVKINKILSMAAQNGGSIGERCVFVAKQLEGTPWSEPHDNDSIGTIMVNLHSFDRMGFVNIEHHLRITAPDVNQAVDVSAVAIHRIDTFHRHQYAPALTLVTLY